ncbi:tryptophan transporter [Clostridium saccharobutylicum]|uniref:Putative tryptophan transport protein n=1 Tax=Clostridium saccharobutylicum TaxID=169679 RepID=A0A1S8NIL0_CLOSA|nr:tryptophan transporter [Clostridium saccharobutylicum]OOM16326.1 putative tryptophan transport protein [Clostridium saccharobutylicum]
MNTKRMVTNAILIAIGAILHQITPPFGMQADFSLAMLFIIIIFNKEYKTALICGIIIGVFAGITSKTPGGLVPNIIDKFITCNVIYLILIPIRNKVSRIKQISLILPLGTLISGTTFLTILMKLVGLPAGLSFQALFISVVIPTIVVNTIIGIAMFKIIEKITSSNGVYVINE